MNNETFLDFCFVREASGNFASEVDQMLTELFKGVRLNWYLDEKNEGGMDIVVAEVKGMSKWESEDETIDFIEDHADDSFWRYLQGYQMYIYPAKGGCSSCGTH